jgi:hypothetical protein
MSPADLLRIDVRPHTRQKGKFTYLSWTWAWAELLKADPAASFDVQMFGPPEHQSPCCWIGETALVFVSVHAMGKTHMCQLPVMDGANKPIQKPDAFAVNKALMRCLVKAIALHGLGLSIYAGEDLSDDEPVQQPEAPAELLTAAREAAGEGKAAFTAFWKVLDPAERKLLAPNMPEYEAACKQVAAGVPA